MKTSGKSLPESNLLPKVLAVFVFISAGLLYSSAFPRRVSILPGELLPFDLEGHQRVLVIAPHCDDETLAAAGLIQQAERIGVEVRVVIETNGDGYLFATMADFRRIYPRSQDYVRMGSVRQGESLAALQSLGLQENQVYFLGYPDRGTPALWNGYWSRSNPYRSPYSNATQSPYERTYNPQSVYAGEDLLQDLMAIIRSYQPDLLIYPHPDDVHPDHWGLSAFTRLALAWVRRDLPDYHPGEMTYLVHRPGFPYPKGLHPDEGVLPPSSLFELDPDWYQLGLDPDEEARKRDAIYLYRSQLPPLRSFLESFVRRNELFAEPQPGELVAMEKGKLTDPETWRDINGKPIEPIVRDPVRDFITREFLAPADLTELSVALYEGDTLAICARVRGNTVPTLIYSLRVLAVGEKGVVRQTARSHFNNHGAQRVQRSGRYFCNQLKLEDLGDPWIVFFGADVEQIGTGIIDQTAWQYLER